MPFYPPEDARALTDYRPSCESNAQLARLLGARTQMEYRQALVEKGALDKVRTIVASPHPGDGQLTNTK